MNRKILFKDLLDLGVIRFGSFTLKSGITSPIYIDLRLTISKPRLLVSIAEVLFQSVKGASFDLLCGVPYTALPFATAISIEHQIPLVLRRKEKKEYGTKRMIEGIFEKGQTCLIVEDVVTSGASIFETAENLREEGLIVKDAVVFIDRGQGGDGFLAKKNIHLHSVFHLPTLIEELLSDGLIDNHIAYDTLNFLQVHRSQ